MVLLHDYKNTRTIFAPLAQRLQSPGEGEGDRPPFAVVTVDLRGHGDSTKQVTPDGFQFELDAARLDKPAVLAMAGLDMEAVRSFLVAKNDAGELNLNKLCLVVRGWAPTWRRIGPRRIGLRRHWPIANRARM